MNKFVLVVDGNIVSTAVSTYLYDGAPNGDGSFWRLAPDDKIDDHTLMNVYYFKDEWKTRDPMPGINWNWNNDVEAWEFNSTRAKSAVVSHFTSVCSKAIVSGFESDATGEVLTYQCEQHDQVNLQSALLTAISTDNAVEIKTTSGTIKHTAEQAKLVWEDYNDHIKANRDKLNVLKEQLKDAINQEEIDDIAKSSL